uniref:Uncharacterized protein n=1 Tax=Globodera rostochiensis TaxID=31243 RepID=A0A914HME2_GLORO
MSEPQMSANLQWFHLKGVATKSGISDTRVSCDENCTIIELPAHFPSSGRVVDTLAACDCFIAGIVPFLNAGNGLLKALKKATFLAGESVGQRGLLVKVVAFISSSWAVLAVACRKRWVPG